ncbi:MAG: XTP/dITP diphosphatase [Armatimonadota bacterium]|nr:XTP/dITP diphosphatase [Armatimonadota bacterium]
MPIPELPIVILATSNEHKLREIAAMLEGAPFRLTSLQEFPHITLPPETGSTFEENAAGKAVAATAASGLVVIGDDSGLEVNALHGEPGVWSARYAGPHATDEENLQRLLQALDGVPEGERTARFVCAIAVARPDGAVETVRGTCEGEIIRAKRGANGFGYDPVFLIPEDGRTLAEFSPAEKNRISHRSGAIQGALPLILRALEDDKRS